MPKEKFELFCTEDAVHAFIWAVSMAAFSFNLMFMLPHLVSFESATNYSFLQRTWDSLITLAFSFAMTWIAAFVLCLIPYAIGILFAKAGTFSSKYYFIGGAIFTALWMFPFFSSIPNLNVNDQAVNAQQNLTIAKQWHLFVVPGLLAGWTCWWRIFRYPRRRISAPDSCESANSGS